MSLNDDLNPVAMQRRQIQKVAQEVHGVVGLSQLAFPQAVQPLGQTLVGRVGVVVAFEPFAQRRRDVVDHFGGGRHLGIPTAGVRVDYSRLDESLDRSLVGDDDVYASIADGDFADVAVDELVCFCAKPVSWTICRTLS
ncbi:MAG: hypothetical protein JWN19_551 [Arthrobacter sp.]|nr:hypothetical protein [Arthrobacter sp.]